MQSRAKRPVLDGIRILDLSWGIAGPVASMMLSDNGAEVVKVEPPDGDPFRSQPGYLVWNRGKRSLAVDLKHPEGQAILHRLARGADVLLESFAPGVAQRLGADYERLAAINPRLVYCSISGYGPDGPHAESPGYDHLVAARTGVYEQPGFRPGPTFVVFPLPSYGAALLAVQGIAVALYVREMTGRGQRVETSLLGGSFAMQPSLVAVHDPKAQLPNPGATGRSPFGASPFYRLYQCQDDRWLQFGCINAGFVRKAAGVLGLQKVMQDPRFGDGRSIPTDEARQELIGLVADRMRQRPYHEWARLFDEADVPYAPPDTTEEYMEDPQVLYSRQVVELEDPMVGRMKQMGLPLVFHETPGRIQGPSPTVGQHTLQILEEVGYSSEEVAGLEAEGVIRIGRS